MPILSPKRGTWPTVPSGSRRHGDRGRACLAVRLVGAPAPTGSGGVYANFPDADLRHEHRAYWGVNLERVRRVKERWDPEGLFG
jgi:hypothetical protein